MKKTIILIFIILTLMPFMYAQNDFAYNRLYNDIQPSSPNATGGDWITSSLGTLTDANSSQFFSVNGILNINQTFLGNITDGSFLRLDGTNIPTANYNNWVTNLVTSGVISIGTTGTNFKLTVALDDSGSLPSPSTGTVAVFQNNGVSDSAFIQINAATNAISGIDFGDTSDSSIGNIQYDHSIDTFRFNIQEGERFAISSTVVTSDVAFRADSSFRAADTSANVGAIWFTDSSNTVTNDGEFLIDVGSGRLGVLQSFPQFTLDVAGTGNFDSSVQISTDDSTLCFGVAQDGCIFYNGTDLVINPKVVGTGSFFVQGQIQINNSGVPLQIQNNVDSASNQIAIFKGGNRATPTDGDEIYNSYMLDNSLGVQDEFARITVEALDVTSTSKDSRLQFRVRKANTLRNVMELGNNRVIFNQDSQDIDFRIESNDLTNMLFINAGTDTLTIGSATVLAFFGIDGANNEIQTVIQGFSTQTVPIFVVENSAGVDLFTVDNFGNINFAGNISIDGTLVMSVNATCTFIHSPAGTTIFEVCDV